MIIARSADFRLDPQLKLHCAKDIEELCMPAYYEVADLPDDHAEVITCLQDFRYRASLSTTVFLVSRWLHASSHRIGAAVNCCTLAASPEYSSAAVLCMRIKQKRLCVWLCQHLADSFFAGVRWRFGGGGGGGAKGQSTFLGAGCSCAASGIVFRCFADVAATKSTVVV